MGGGGGGGWNPFEGVSWNKPFGDSAASNLVGGAGGISSIGQGVSWDKPFGDTSSLGQALYGNSNAPLTSEGKSKETGEQVIIPGTQGSSTSNDPQFGGTFVQPPAPSYNTNAIPVAPLSGPGALPKYGNNAAEMAFRDAYLKNFTPNVNYNINAEATPYKAISPTGIGNTSNLQRRS